VTIVNITLSFTLISDYDLRTCDLSYQDYIAYLSDCIVKRIIASLLQILDVKEARPLARAIAQ
jgi:hypothetical protein